MKKERLIPDKKYVFWAITILFIFVSYLIIKPFIIALVSSFILSYLVRPVYVRFNTKLNAPLSAALSIALTILVLIVPAAFLVGEVIHQASIYAQSGFISQFLTQLSSSPLVESLRVDGVVNNALSAGVTFLSNRVYSIPTILVSIFITLFGMYYILIDWDKLTKGLKNFLPFKNKNEVAGEISKITRILVYGTLWVGILEFFVASLGFYLLGIRFYLILAALVFLFAFLPGLGPTLVWVPVAIYFAINGQYVHLGGTLLLGFILSFILDASFRARLLGGKAKINPFVMLVGIFGGVAIFGIFGFIIGPLILSYTLKILNNIFAEEQKN